MINKNKSILLTILITIFISVFANAQEENSELNKELYKQVEFFDIRGTNAIDVAVGTSLINGDYSKPEPEYYFRIGYKHHFTSHLNVNFTFNKYNIAFDDVYHQGYMSFDLNLEYMVSPYNTFSPFVYAGYGYNASNAFETTQAKVQIGAGLEYVVVEGVGVKLFGEYNSVFSNELKGLIIPNKDESFLRIGLGVNLYFGGNKRKEKLLKNIETIINSNLIN